MQTPHTTDRSPPATGDPNQPIPDPVALRRLIGFRAAELAILRRLLRLADDQAKLFTHLGPKGVGRG